MGPGGIFLCQRWTHCLSPNLEAAKGVHRPHRPLWPGQSQEEYVEDSEHGLPAMPRAWQDVGGGVREADNGDRANVLGKT